VAREAGFPIRESVLYKIRGLEKTLEDMKLQPETRKKLEKNLEDLKKVLERDETIYQV
jgi:uncharacterized coiled-coil DUF342 family protein